MHYEKKKSRRPKVISRKEGGTDTIWTVGDEGSVGVERATTPVDQGSEKSVLM